MLYGCQGRVRPIARPTSAHSQWQSDVEFKLTECFDRYDHPPYWQTEGYRVPFGVEQYEEMASMLAKLKGKAIISLNDHPDIRWIFADYHIETTDIRYTVGGGKGTDAKEVLIFSWDVDAEPAGRF